MSDHARDSSSIRVTLSELSRQEAADAQSELLGTQHILLAFLGDYENSAARILSSYAVTREKAEAAIKQVMAEGVCETQKRSTDAESKTAALADQKPSTEQASQAFRKGSLEVIKRRDPVAVWAHILLGLLMVEEGIAAKSLAALDLDFHQLRTSIFKLLDSPDVPVP